MQSTENTPETRRHVDVEILADAVLGEAFVRKSNLLESAGNQLHELARDLHRTELALAAERDRADRMVPRESFEVMCADADTWEERFHEARARADRAEARLTQILGHIESTYAASKAEL